MELQHPKWHWPNHNLDNSTHAFLHIHHLRNRWLLSKLYRSLQNQRPKERTPRLWDQAKPERSHAPMAKNCRTLPRQKARATLPAYLWHHQNDPRRCPKTKIQRKGLRDCLHLSRPTYALVVQKMPVHHVKLQDATHCCRSPKLRSWGQPSWHLHGESVSEKFVCDVPLCKNLFTYI